MGIKRHWLIAGTAFVCLWGAAVPSAARPIDSGRGAAGTKDLGGILEPIRQKHGLPALGAAVVTGQGLQGIGVAGVRKAGTDVPATADDLWHLGSDTKAMTAFLIAALVEQGTIKWETTVGETFPELAAAAASPEFGKITLRRLLTHRSGLPANILWGVIPRSRPIGEQRLAAVKAASLAKLDPAPGTKYVYSNLGYVVAGAMAERAAGASWEDLMKETVFGPLGMKSAGFGGVGTPGQADQPWGHGADGRPVKANGPDADNPPVMGPAGTVHCTLADWAKFVADILRGARGEEALLKPATYATLLTPPPGGDYAFGWMVADRDWGGGRVLTHSGSNTMNLAVAWLAPLRNFAVLVVTNQGPPASVKACDEAASALIAEAAAGSGAPGPAAPAQAQATRTAALDRGFVPELKDHLDRLEKLGFSGAVLAAVDGDPLLAQGYGLADREHGTPWWPATISTVGSITKQFTAAAILKLEEEGRLSVSDPIAKYFDGVPPDKAPITIHQLLTHSSGIEDLEGRGDFDPLGRDEFVGLALRQRLAFPPGKDYSYSNAGYSLLGAIIEKLTAGGYEQYLRRTFFLPLGMYETGYVLPAWGGGRLAQGYRGNERWGTILDRPMASDGPYWVLRANGGIHSNCFDMLRWATALLDGRVLKPESVAKAWTPHVSEGGDSSYGYGWSIRTFPDGIKVITHNGGNGIFFADYAIVPKLNLVIFIQTNVLADLPAAPRLLERIGSRILAGRPFPDLPKVIDIPQERLAPYAGVYRMTGGAGAFRVSGEGKGLVLEPQGPAAFALLHSTKPFDPGRRDKLDRLMDRVIAACRAGDFGPLADAYGGEVEVERLKASWRRMVAEAERRFGPLRGHEVLGSARTDEREETVVRLKYEKGAADRTYVWRQADPPRLEGVSERGLKPKLAFLPTSDTEFASWDGGLRPSQPLRFEKDAAGRSRLRLGGAGTPAVEATRE